MTSEAGKECAICGAVFTKRPRASAKQWAARVTCSVLCGNRRKGILNTQNIKDRLEKYIERIPESGCWIWVGTHDGRYYGHISAGHGKSPLKAHRVAYQQYVGQIPDGKLVRHRCDVPACVNPHHLEIGTQEDNMADMMKRGRFNQSIKENLQHVRSFTQEQAEEVRRLASYNLSSSEIARQYGVDRSTVSLYVNNKR